MHSITTSFTLKASCLTGWLQHKIYCASLLAKVITLASSRILYFMYFAQPSGKIGDNLGYLIQPFYCFARCDDEKNQTDRAHRDEVEENQLPHISNQKKGLQALDEVPRRNDVCQTLNDKGHALNFEKKAREHVGGQKAGGDRDL